MEKKELNERYDSPEMESVTVELSNHILENSCINYNEAPHEGGGI